jgi:arsenate reductase
MAEAWAKHLKHLSIEAYSAGIEVHGLNKYAVKVMSELGIDMSDHRSKMLTEFSKVHFDFVITLCGNAQETCPFFPGNAKVIHHGFDDPPKLAANARTEDEILPHYRRVRDQIKEFVMNIEKFLVK